jgi:PHD/YefM family antitoxin component YafN of YafNO toxin-antitoxin module
MDSSSVEQPVAPLALQAINQALSALMAAWVEMESHDVIIYLNERPVAALIPFEDYQTLQQQEILADMRDGRQAEAVYQEWLRDPGTARPYAEFRAELVAEELLDEFGASSTQFTSNN